MDIATLDLLGERAPHQRQEADRPPRIAFGVAAPIGAFAKAEAAAAKGMPSTKRFGSGRPGIAGGCESAHQLEGGRDFAQLVRSWHAGRRRPPSSGQEVYQWLTEK